jgi:hypothetical protein
MTQMRTILVVVVATLVVGGALSCGESGGSETPTPLSLADGQATIGQAIQQVLKPDLDIAVKYSITTNATLFGHQPRILNGAKGIPGLYAVRDSLMAGDTHQACTQIGGLLRGLILNRLLRATGEDAYKFTHDDAKRLDPDDIFLLPPQTIRHGVNDGFEIVGVDPKDGAVVSVLWRQLSEDLMQLVYGLGNDCVQAAAP